MLSFLAFALKEHHSPKSEMRIFPLTCGAMFMLFLRYLQIWR